MGVDPELLFDIGSLPPPPSGVWDHAEEHGVEEGGSFGGGSRSIHDALAAFSSLGLDTDAAESADVEAADHGAALSVDDVLPELPESVEEWGASFSQWLLPVPHSDERLGGPSSRVPSVDYGLDASQWELSEVEAAHSRLPFPPELLPKLDDSDSGGEGHIRSLLKLSELPWLHLEAEGEAGGRLVREASGESAAPPVCDEWRSLDGAALRRAAGAAEGRRRPRRGAGRHRGRARGGGPGRGARQPGVREEDGHHRLRGGGGPGPAAPQGDAHGEGLALLPPRRPLVAARPPLLLRAAPASEVAPLELLLLHPVRRLRSEVLGAVPAVPARTGGR